MVERRIAIYIIPLVELGLFIGAAELIAFRQARRHIELSEQLKSPQATVSAFSTREAIRNKATPMVPPPKVIDAQKKFDRLDSERLHMEWQIIGKLTGLAALFGVSILRSKKG